MQMKIFFMKNVPPVDSALPNSETAAILDLKPLFWHGIWLLLEVHEHGLQTSEYMDVAAWFFGV